MNPTTHTGEMSAIVLRSLAVDEAIRYAVHDAAVDEAGQRITPKQVAGRMDVPEKLLYEITSRRPARAREVGLIVRATRCFLPLDLLESEVGRIAWQLPVLGALGDPAAKKAAEACREFGELMQEYGASSGDRRYTRDEAARIRIAAEELCRAAMALVSEVERDALMSVAV